MPPAVHPPPDGGVQKGIGSQARAPPPPPVAAGAAPAAAAVPVGQLIVSVRIDRAGNASDYTASLLGPLRPIQEELPTWSTVPSSQIQVVNPAVGDTFRVQVEMLPGGATATGRMGPAGAVPPGPEILFQRPAPGAVGSNRVALFDLGVIAAAPTLTLRGWATLPGPAPAPAPAPAAPAVIAAARGF